MTAENDILQLATKLTDAWNSRDPRRVQRFSRKTTRERTWARRDRIVGRQAWPRQLPAT